MTTFNTLPPPETLEDNEDDNDDEGDEGNAHPPSSFAPSYLVPQTRVVSIEHPCIIHNFENGLKSLGGEHQIKHLFESSTEPATNDGPVPSASPVYVSLRPNDPFAKKITSASLPTHNLLLKVTVPKRTGRKRKRGTDDPFTEDQTTPSPSPNPTASTILQYLRDNPDSYTVEPQGTIAETHRFRNAPDLQMLAHELPIMRELRDHAMSPNYDTLKQFHVNLRPSRGLDNLQFPAPPMFFSAGPLFQYGYAQHLEPLRHRLPPQLLPRDAHTPVPTGPRTQLPTSYTKSVGTALPVLKRLLESRPLITMQMALHHLPAIPKPQMEVALLYVAYYACHGPWRGTWIAYGVDPRQDAAHRLHQTVYTPFSPPPIAGVEGRESSQPLAVPAPPPAKEKRRPRGSGRKPYIRKTPQAVSGEPFDFDGQRVAPTQLVFQLCDLTAPLLARLVHGPGAAREECDVELWGWFRPEVLVKVIVLTTELVWGVRGGQRVNEALLERFAELDLDAAGEVDDGSLRGLVEEARRVRVMEESERQGDVREEPMGSKTRRNGVEGEREAGDVEDDPDDEDQEDPEDPEEEDAEEEE